MNLKHGYADKSNSTYRRWMRLKSRVKSNGWEMDEQWATDYPVFLDWVEHHELSVPYRIVRIDRSNPRVGPDNMCVVPECVYNKLNGFYREPVISSSTKEPVREGYESKVFCRSGAHGSNTYHRGFTLEEALAEKTYHQLAQLEAICHLIPPKLYNQIKGDLESRLL